MMKEAGASKILDRNKGKTMKDVWYPSMSVQSVNLWKGLLCGHNLKHKYFCVLHAIINTIILAAELSCHVHMVNLKRLSQRLPIGQTEAWQFRQQ
jgi:hypothetical protein